MGLETRRWRGKDKGISWENKIMTYPWRQIGRRAEIHPVLFTDMLDLLPGPCQPLQLRMELGQIVPKHGRSVPRRVTRDKYRSYSIRMLLLHDVQRRSQLIQLIRTYIRTMREAEVDQCVFPQQVRLGEFVPVEITQRERSADFRFSVTLRHLDDALTVEAGFLVLEVEDHDGAGGDEQCG